MRLSIEQAYCQLDILYCYQKGNIMNKSYRYKALLTSAILLFALPLFSQADPSDKEMHKHKCDSHGIHDGEHGMGNNHKMGGGFAPFLKDLNLSAEQKEKIKTLMEAEKPEIQAHHEKRQALMTEMHALASSEKIDEAKSQKIAESLGTLEKESALKRMNSMSKLLSILNPEQRASALDELKKHMSQAKPKPTSFNINKQNVQSLFKS